MPSVVTRFGLVGIANTSIGYGAIVVALLAGLGDYAANAIGYAVGLGLSFALNRSFTFGASGRVSRGEVLRFAIAVAMAYAANLAVLTLARTVLGPEHPLAHLPAIATYTAVFFLANLHFVYPSHARR